MYLPDPLTKQPSVSLTMAVVAFVFALGFCAAESLEYVKNSGPLMELFYACAALYFGRRLQIGAKTFSSDKDK